MKKILAVLIVAFITLSFGTAAQAISESAIPAEVLEVAESGVTMLQSHMSSNPEKWGFQSVDEIENLILGKGYYVNFIDFEKLENFSGDKISDLFASDMFEKWEFTLDLNGIPKVFLTVGYEDGAYRIIHYGGNAESFGIAKNRMSYQQSDSADIQANEILVDIGGKYCFISGDMENVVLVDSTIMSSRNMGIISADEFVDMLQKELLNADLETYGGKLFDDLGQDCISDIQNITTKVCPTTVSSRITNAYLPQMIAISLLSILGLAYCSHHYRRDK